MFYPPSPGYPPQQMHPQHQLPPQQPMGAPSDRQQIKIIHDSL